VASYSLTQLSSDIRGAVSALGHSRATLVAHDWGGCVAWVTAGRWGGDLLDGLVVLGLPHLGVAATNMDSDQQKRSSYILTFQVGAPVVLVCGCGCVGGGGTLSARGSTPPSKAPCPSRPCAYGPCSYVLLPAMHAWP
jgi:pimeloyl-ACP methyl ester carboxylesterase